MVRYVVENNVGDGIWEAYSGGTADATVAGFVAAVEGGHFYDVLREYVGDVLPEYAELVDVTQRTARDTLTALRYTI